MAAGIESHKSHADEHVPLRGGKEICKPTPHATKRVYFSGAQCRVLLTRHSGNLFRHRGRSSPPRVTVRIQANNGTTSAGAHGSQSGP